MKMKQKIMKIVVVFFLATVCFTAVKEPANAAKKKVIAIDAGHQSKENLALERNGPGSSVKKVKVSSGATGVATKLPEYKLNLQVAKKLKKELKRRGYKVVMIRTSNNVNISNRQRAKIANAAKADAFIRIHANFASSSSVNGALTMAPTSKNKYLSEKIRKASRLLSQKVLSAYCSQTGAKNRGVKYTDTMTGINWCTVPVTIVEMGFMSNRKEDRKMATAAYQKKIVRGIAKGIDCYFESSR